MWALLLLHRGYRPPDPLADQFIRAIWNRIANSTDIMAVLEQYGMEMNSRFVLAAAGAEDEELMRVRLPKDPAAMEVYRGSRLLGEAVKPKNMLMVRLLIDVAGWDANEIPTEGPYTGSRSGYEKKWRCTACCGLGSED